MLGLAFLLFLAGLEIDLHQFRGQAGGESLQCWASLLVMARYGTIWGVARGLLGAAGLTPRAATADHGAAVWGSAQVMLPALDVAPPVIFWPPAKIAIDVFHHAVYVLTTGIAYEMLGSGKG